VVSGLKHQEPFVDGTVSVGLPVVSGLKHPEPRVDGMMSVGLPVVSGLKRQKPRVDDTVSVGLPVVSYAQFVTHMSHAEEAGPARRKLSVLQISHTSSSVCYIYVTF
jgi:hypothetical protein